MIFGENAKRRLNISLVRQPTKFFSRATEFTVTEKAKTLDALTGLRFIAALAVFTHHVTGKFSIPDIDSPMGDQAVSFFFVLSGFILTYVYSSRLQWSNLRKFYFTRWARIWPLHIVCLLLILGFLYSLENFKSDPQIWSKFFSNVFLLQSWVPDNAYVFGFNGVSWSISTEAFFYLAFPVFLLGGQKKFWFKYVGLVLLTVVLIAAGTMISHTNWFPSVDYQRLGHNNPLLRLPEFCTGMAVGFIYLNGKQKNETDMSLRPRSFVLDTLLEVVAVVAVAGYPILASKSSLLTDIYSAAWGGPFLGSFISVSYGGFLFAAVIYLFSKSTGVISRICSTRIMVFLGEVSFAFYMIHAIVLKLVAANVGDDFSEWPPLLVATLLASLSLAASILLYKIVEMPAKNGLLALHDQKWSTGILAIPKAAWDFSRTKLFVFTILLAVGSIFLLGQYRPTPVSSSQIQSIVEQSDPEFRGIKFDQSVELLGCNVKVQKEGWLITLAWKKLDDFPHSRCVHVCDESDEIVGYGALGRMAFMKARVGDEIIDSFFLKNNTLTDGTKVGIGFFGRGVNMMQPDRGPRSMRNQRLDVIQPELFSELKAARK